MTRPSFKNAEGHELFDGTSMTEAARSPQPRTAAGRAILRRLHPLTGGTLISIPHAKRIGLVELLRPLVLAIEAEAAQHSLERSVRRGGLDLRAQIEAVLDGHRDHFSISEKELIANLDEVLAEGSSLTSGDVSGTGNPDSPSSAPQPSARLTPQRKPPADPRPVIAHTCPNCGSLHDVPPADPPSDAVAILAAAQAAIDSLPPSMKNALADCPICSRHPFHKWGEAMRAEMGPPAESREAERPTATDKALLLLHEVAKGWEPGPGPFEVGLPVVNRVINFLDSHEG